MLFVATNFEIRISVSIEACMNYFMRKVMAAYLRYLGDKLVSLVLFGSRARGDAQETSDYDLFIVAHDLPAKPWDRQLFLRKPLAPFRESFSVVGRTTEEFEAALPSLYLDLAVDGLILFDRNDYIAAKFRRIKELIAQAGLRREKIDGELMWLWDRPVRPGWELEWEGFVEFAERR